MNLTQETIKMLAEARDLSKAVTTSTGLVAYDLQAPAKNLYPVLTPIRNSLPRVKGAGGTATNWKQITSIAGSGYDASGWVPEGQRSARMSYTAVDKSATYRTIGEEDSVTDEAVWAGRGFEDVQATAIMRLLQKTMLKEENAIFGGNASVALGTPTAPTTSTATTGGTIVAATYNIAVVALSHEGYLNSSLAGGVATSQVVTGADGDTFTVKGGSSNKSSTAAQATTGSTSTLSASTPAIRGAVAYAWYVGTAGNEKLEAITTINSVTLTALVGGAQQALTAITADNSRNDTYGFDGLLYAAFNSSNLAYFRSLPTGTAGVGTVLTASSRGSVAEIDVMLKAMWDTYRISVEEIFVNSQELKNISDKVLSSSGAPLVRFNADMEGGVKVTAGNVVGSYFNPFNAEGGVEIPIKIHPTLAAGTLVGRAKNLPAHYQSNHTPNVAEVHVQQEYHQIDWPRRSRKSETGVYVREVPAIYATFGLGIITNIANG